MRRKWLGERTILSLAVIALSAWLWSLILNASGAPAGRAAYRATQVTSAPPMQLVGAHNLPAGHGSLEEGSEVVARQRVQANAEALRAQGILSTPILSETNPVLFTWPVRQAAGYQDFGFYAITHLVDHDPNNPGSLLDYACGERSYDIAGYNHGGVDIVPWPFPWNQMAENAIEVVAAADGVIVDKVDSDANDQNCSLLEGNSFGNYLAIAHADGKVSWYAHMKYNSLTAKGIGDSVVTGEYLGVVGSSGISSGPHLHFEVRADSSILAPKLDPFAGQCNLLNPDTGSLWVEQPPYYDSGINKLTVGSAAPEFRPCPELTITNDETTVNAGQLVYFSAYHRDLLASQVTTYTLYQPDGQAYTTWTWPSDLSNPEPYDAFEARTWPKHLWPTVPVGTWRFEAQFEGEVYTRLFEVLPPAGDNILYLSADTAGSVEGVDFGPEDILIYDMNNNTWAMFFDGSDVGATANIDAFVRYGSFLILSFSERTQLPGIFRFIEPADLVTFRPQSTGDTTSGRFTFYFDGSDVGLETEEENVDALAFNENNEVVMSLAGAYSVPDDQGNTLTGEGGDILIFHATDWYGNTSGSWELYLTGADIDLAEASESIDGLWINPLSTEIYVSAAGAYEVPGVSGDDDDIIACAIAEGPTCSWTTFFDWGLYGIDALYLEPALDINQP